MVAGDGLLERLEWYDFNKCSDCSGAGSDRCVMTTKQPESQIYPQESCAYNPEDFACRCRGRLCESTANNCTTTFIAAFRGNTASGQSLQSAYELTSAFKYSITAAFNNFFDDLGDDLGDFDVDPTGEGIAIPGGTTGGGTPATSAPPALFTDGNAAVQTTTAPTTTAPPTTVPAATLPETTVDAFGVVEDFQDIGVDPNAETITPQTNGILDQATLESPVIFPEPVAGT